ncbi:hypothetical protein AW27_023215 [Streptomyces sp. PCS3-D2]|uniref:hypothetical protein n=1 Tax=Streptomyces sp. PCS3-D2 TaxID=1460244 RepID=UPI0004470395|nr:hypothetical protein [Streptomyces sp. PCS3-D2]WKV74155.1 hypothetical protein AW27_023215 [Streptomyces sp. PCS3-D2]
MQLINITVSAIAENGTESTLIALGAAVLGPPVTKRLVGLTREFWGPKVTRLRRVIADRVAPPEPAEDRTEEVVHLSERV